MAEWGGIREIGERFIDSDLKMCILFVAGLVALTSGVILVCQNVPEIWDAIVAISESTREHTREMLVD